MMLATVPGARPAGFGSWHVTNTLLLQCFFFLEMVTLRQLLLGTEEPGGGFVSIHRVEGDEVATLLLPT